MLVRVVNIQCIAGLEEELRRIGREVLVPVNREAGCVDVYFLEPNPEVNNPSFGVVSVWPDTETLNQMKNSEKYLALREQMAPFIESFTDELYVSVSEE